MFTFKQFHTVQVNTDNKSTTNQRNYDHPLTSVSGLNSFGDSTNDVPTRRRGVGVGFPEILGISAGITPVISCTQAIHSQDATAYSAHVSMANTQICSMQSF